MNIEQIAEICHEANKVLCEQNGDNSQKHWAEAAAWQRDSAIAGVKFALENRDAPPSAQHDAWARDKVRDGWVYGEEKDEVAQTHPCLVPYSELPRFQRSKDVVFKGIVNALAEFCV